MEKYEGEECNMRWMAALELDLKFWSWMEFFTDEYDDLYHQGWKKHAWTRALRMHKSHVLRNGSAECTCTRRKKRILERYILSRKKLFKHFSFECTVM